MSLLLPSSIDSSSLHHTDRPAVADTAKRSSNIMHADPLSLAVARRWMEDRRKSRSWADYSQRSRESPWLALNRSIARAVTWQI
jgi:hypothetical protein